MLFIFSDSCPEVLNKRCQAPQVATPHVPCYATCHAVELKKMSLEGGDNSAHKNNLLDNRKKNIIYAKQRPKQVFVQEKIILGVINPILSTTLIHTNQKHMCRNYIIGWLCSPLLGTFVTETGVHSFSKQSSGA